MEASKIEFVLKNITEVFEGTINGTITEEFRAKLLASMQVLDKELQRINEVLEDLSPEFEDDIRQIYKNGGIVKAVRFLTANANCSFRAAINTVNKLK